MLILRIILVVQFYSKRVESHLVDREFIIQNRFNTRQPLWKNDTVF